MKFLKGALSALLCMAMVLSAVPVVQVQAADADTVVSNNNLTVAANNNVATMLSADMQHAQQAQSEQESGYNVTGLTVENGIATAQLNVAEPAILVIDIYAEDSLQRKATGKVEVCPEDTEAQVTPEGKIPMYFVVRAHLEDPETGAILCTAYETSMYTRSMQTLLASTAEDYDIERVLNFDNSKNTNFAVYADSVTILTQQENENVLLSADDETKTYIIENPDMQLAALGQGDIFALPQGSNDALIVKIGSIAVTGATVTITGQDVKSEEAFACVKLEVGTEKKGPATRDVDKTWPEKFGFDFKSSEALPEALKSIKLENPNGSGPDLEFSPEFNLSMWFDLTISAKYYSVDSYKYAELKVDYTVSTSFGAALAVEATIELNEIMLDVEFISVGFAPTVVFTTEGSHFAAADIAGTLGASYDADTGFKNLSTMPKLTPKGEIKGSFSAGIDWHPCLRVVGGDLAEFALETYSGVECTASNATSNQINTIHTCKEPCIDIDIYSAARVSAEITFLNGVPVYSNTLAQQRKKLADWYYSREQGMLLNGVCPNLKHKVTIQVLDYTFQNVEGAKLVALDNLQPPISVSFGTTATNGIVEAYITEGVYTFVATFGNNIYARTKSIEAPCKILVDPFYEAEHVYLGIHPDDFKDHNADGWKPCGGAIYYTVERDRILHIFGKGAMTDWEFGGESLWAGNEFEHIEKVIIEDGVTTIGNYAFSSCTNIKSLEIPDTVISIGYAAFENCMELTSVELGKGIRYIGDFAFSDCRKLRAVKLPDSVITIGNSAFSWCRALTSVVMGDGVTSIGHNAFRWCMELTDIIIGENVNFIGEDAFESCVGLERMTVGQAVANGYCGDFIQLFGGTLSESYYLPQIMFELSFHDNVTVISGNVFENSSVLISLTIPDSVTNIDDSAFANCLRLSEIRFTGHAPSIDPGSFYNVTADVYYPANDPSWTKEVRQNYEGDITWIPYGGVKKFDIDVARMILGNALEFQFGVTATKIPEKTGYYAIIEKTWADGTTTEKTIPASEWGKAGQYWAIVYDGLAAKEMGDTFYVTIYNAEGLAVSNTKQDSVRDYVERAFDSQKNAGKTMMVDMLNYGAAAQIEFEYGTNDLANNKLTDEQKAFGTPGDVTMNNNVVKGDNYQGSRFILESRIQVQLAFKNLASNMYATYTYENAKGVEKTVRVEGSDFIIINGAPAGVELSELVYADARTMVKVTVYNADGSVYGYAEDSMEGYAARITKSDDVFVALMKFADSARAYLY